MSTSTDSLAALNSPGERRFYPRIAPSRPIYIAFGGDNLGMLLNLGENGLLVSTPSALDLNSVYHVSLRLNGLAKPIEVHVRTVWTTESMKRAGIQLLDLSEHDREQIRKWGALELSRRKNAEPQPAQQSSKPHQEKPASPPFVAGPIQKSERPFAPAFAAAPLPLAPFDAETHLDFPLPQDLAVPRRSEKKSGTPALLAWGGLGAVIGIAVALFFDLGLAEKFLNRSNVSGIRSAASSHAPAPPLTAFDNENPADADPAPSLTELPSPETSSSRPPAPAAVRTNSPSDTSLTKYAYAKPSTPRTYTLPAPKHFTEAAETPAASHSGSADSDSAQFAANEASNALPTTITRAPADNPPLASIPAPVAPAPSAKSAITGSIASAATHAVDSTTSTAPPQATAVSPVASGPAWPISGPPVSAGRTSFFHPRSDSAVVHMDAAPGPVTDITPPRGLSSSFVTLPGERVLESPAVTMHIQRSVLVPGDRWLWHTHKKVALGELTSRIDPQISRPPTTSGSITVQASIDKNGRVSNLKPLNGSFVYLPTVAIAIREWRYEPTYLDNKPVETQAQIELDFHPPSRR